MTQENKELLLKELSSRYPYEIILHFDDKVEQDDEPLYNIRKNGNTYLINDAYYLEEVKPYLRSMKSMRKEEEILNRHYQTELSCSELYDFYNSRHLDYRGLIEKGLAIEAPDGMYN